MPVAFLFTRRRQNPLHDQALIILQHNVNLPFRRTINYAIWYWEGKTASKTKKSLHPVFTTQIKWRVSHLS